MSPFFRKESTLFAAELNARFASKNAKPAICSLSDNEIFAVLPDGVLGVAALNGNRLEENEYAELCVLTESKGLEFTITRNKDSCLTYVLDSGNAFVNAEYCSTRAMASLNRLHKTKMIELAEDLLWFEGKLGNFD